jgi:hypothetical protein
VHREDSFIVCPDIHLRVLPQSVHDLARLFSLNFITNTFHPMANRQVLQ